MSNVIVEGFATYGIGQVYTPNLPTALSIRNAMLSGAWADVPITVSNQAVGRLPFDAQDTAMWYGGDFAQRAGDSSNLLRRVLPQSTDEIILAFRLALGKLPSTANTACIVDFRNASNIPLCALVVGTTGTLELYGSDRTTLLLITSGPVLVAEASAHLEMLLNTTTGVFELYVNGTKVLDGTGLAITAVNIAQFSFLNRPSGTAGSSDSGYITDLIIRTTSGDYNNTILGDRRIATLIVNRDDPDHQGWTARPLKRFGVGILENLASRTGVVTASASTQTDLGAGDFTIEGSFRLQRLPNDATKAVIFGKWNDASNQRSYQLYLGGPSLEDGALVFRTSTDGTAATVEEPITWPWEPDLGRWYHLAVVRVSGELLLFIDGEQQGLPVADARTYFAGPELTALAGQYNTNTVADTGWPGWMDEFRLSVGVARYTANFTPPDEAFPRGVDDPFWSSVQWLSSFDTGIFDESAAARTLTARGASLPVAITPNDGVFNYQVIDKIGVPLDYSFLEAALLAAEGVLTFGGLPTDGKTVTIGTKDGTDPAVYTWVAALTNPYDVLIGADVEESMNNLIAAIIGGSGEGTVYGTGTVSNFDVVAALLPSIQVLVTANVAGSDGNSIATTTDDPAGSWEHATLTGGQNIPPYSQFGFERPPNRTTVVDSATLVSRAWKSDSGPATYKQSLVGPAGAATDGAAHPLTTVPTYYFDTFEEDPDTEAPITPTTLVSGKVRLNRTV